MICYGEQCFNFICKYSRSYIMLSFRVDKESLQNRGGRKGKGKTLHDCECLRNSRRQHFWCRAANPQRSCPFGIARILRRRKTRRINKCRGRCCRYIRRHAATCPAFAASNHRRRQACGARRERSAAAALSSVVLLRRRPRRVGTPWLRLHLR